MAFAFNTPPDSDNYTGSSGGPVSDTVYYLDFEPNPKIQMSSQGSFTCNPPCYINWTGTTSRYRSLGYLYIVSPHDLPDLMSSDDRASFYYFNTTLIGGSSKYGSISAQGAADKGRFSIYSQDELQAIIIQTGDGGCQLGRSAWFKFQINNWYYTSGEPVGEFQSGFGGLSTAAKAGAGIAITIIGIMLIWLLSRYFKRRTVSNKKHGLARCEEEECERERELRALQPVIRNNDDDATNISSAEQLHVLPTYAESRNRPMVRPHEQLPAYEF